MRATVTSEIETRLQTISQKILSRSRLEELIEPLQPLSRPAHADVHEEVVERLRARHPPRAQGHAASERGRPGTVAFALSYRGAIRSTVALVTNTVATFYLEENPRAARAAGHRHDRSS